MGGDGDIEADLVQYFGKEATPEDSEFHKFVEGLNMEKPMPRGQRVATAGIKNVVESLACLSRPCTLGMRDYFPYWHKAGRTGDTGKLLLVDFLNETRLDVFFDDNIQETGEDTGIIAVQDTAGNGITPVYAHRYYLVRADARAILNDRDWYLRELATKLKKAEHRRKARVRWRECMRRELKRMKQAISTSVASAPCSSTYRTKSWNHDRMQMRKRHRFRPRVRSQLSDREDSSSNDGDSSPIRVRSDLAGRDLSFSDDGRGVPFSRFKSTPWGHS